MMYQWLTRKCQYYVERNKQAKPIRAFDIVLFFRQLATLIQARIPLIQTFELLEKIQEKNTLRLVIYAIKKDILSGKSLFDSMSYHANYFDSLTCQLIKIGEHTGKLDHLLLSIANYQEAHLARQERLKQILFYPSLVFMTAIIMTLCLLIFVIPHFAALFQTLPYPLPPLTQAIFYLSSIMQTLIWYFIILFVLFFFIYRRMKLTKQKAYLRRIIMRLPLITTCVRQITLVNLNRQLALMLASGLTIIDALRLSGQACADPTFTLLIHKLRYQLTTGLTLYQAMSLYPDFPPLMIHLIKTGEETGMLESMLNKIADFIENDHNKRIEKLTLLLEPLIMLMLGVLIGGLVISMYLPIFNVGSTLSS